MTMNSGLRRTLLGACMALVSTVTLAQDPGHPRVNEVDQRLANQQQRIQAGVADGQINARQAARDERHDERIAARADADEARQGGHLTAGQTRRLNRQLNRNSKRIYDQRHTP